MQVLVRRGAARNGERMTLTEAAVVLGLTAATLRQQIAKGKLAARKVGRDWTVTTGEIERYRRDSRRKGAA